MLKFSTDKLRNVVLISHTGTGKTILSEAMLHTAGVTAPLWIRKRGHVENTPRPKVGRWLRVSRTCRSAVHR
jgi:translation elongation factor EF-G